MSSNSSAESIFDDARRLSDPAERRAYLDRACDGDRELRNRIELLLSAHGEGAFLERPPAMLASAAILPIGERPGDAIGPYKLLEQIGEGGMGLVFVAEQTRPLRRRVALKIIKPGLDTRAVIARFEVERQALALMDHPNIAKIFDAGTTGEMQNAEGGRQNTERSPSDSEIPHSAFPLPHSIGRPYFVMELVRGESITDYCRQRQVPLRQRLELFIEVCHAVQHAHQKGIIHRDLKPTNILVAQGDTSPIPKVIDFGVAKATTQPLTEQTVYTGFSQIIGTPLYMSPEQADLGNQDVDTRSDVYSLGVVLYELLTGTTPFDAERLKSVGADEMRRIIREEEPPKPSTRATTAAGALSTVADEPPLRGAIDVSALRGDLDWIVMKALEKDRRRRYESPSALAADVARHLAHDAVEACPPTRRYRVAKFVRRNRWPLLTAGGLAAALLLGAAASLWQAVRATKAERAQRVALAQARRAVDEMYIKVAENWLADQRELTDVQRDLLQSAVAFYEEFSRETSDDVQLQYEAIRALSRVGAIHYRLKNNDEAESAYLSAIERGAAGARQHAGHPEFEIEVISNRASLALLLRELGHADDAKQQLAQAVIEMNRLKPRGVSQVEYRDRLAKALHSLAGELTLAGRVNDADAVLEMSIDAWQALAEQFPQDFQHRFGLASAYERLGLRQMWWGSTDGKAEATLRQAETLLNSLLAERPDDVWCRTKLAGTLLNLSQVFRWQQRYTDAFEADRRGLELAEGLAQQFPDDREKQDLYAVALGNHARSIDETGGGVPSDESNDLMLKQLLVYERLVDRDPDRIEYARDYPGSLRAVTSRLYFSQEFTQLDRLYEQASSRLKVIAQRFGDDDVVALEMARLLSAKAAQFIERKDYVKAAQCIDEYPLAARQFDVELPARDHDPEAHRIDNHSAESWKLLPPVGLLRRCADLAQSDLALSEDERAALRSKYADLAEGFRREGERAVAAWSQAVIGEVDGAGFRVAVHGEKLILEWLKDRDADDRVGTKVLADVYCDVDRLMFNRLIRAAVERLANEPSQHWISLVLSAAPEELRDVDLALQTARRSVELAPEDEAARQALAWAYFRTGQWQACVDVLPQAQQLASGTIGDDDGPHSVLTMALWQLGRRQEARALFEGASRRLNARESDGQESREQGQEVMPSVSMLKRLHAEATAMLGMDGNNSPGGNDATDRGEEHPASGLDAP